MPSLAEIRQQYPDYSDLSDAALADALHSKFYADMPKEEFYAKVGYSTKDNRGAWDKLTGTGGPRYQLWPERLARSVAGTAVSFATAPGEVASGQLDPMSPEAIERMAGGAMLMSPANPAIRAGDRVIPGVAKALTPQKPVTPTAEALRSEAATGFEASKNMGVALPPAVLQELGRRIEVELQNKGIHPEHAPIAYQTLARLREPPAGYSVTISDIHNLRQAFGNAGGNQNFPKDTLAGSMGVSAVDRVLEAIAEKGSLAGAPAEATRGLKEAIGNSAAAFRSDAVTGRADMAELRAKVANSGQNVDNATRQRFVDIASEGKASRGFNDKEIAGALRVAEGAPATNAARFTGNVLGGGGGLGMAVTSGLGAAGGALVGGPVGAGIGATVGPVLGATSKAIANALTRREVSKLDEMVRQRSPMFLNQLENPTMIPVGAEYRGALIRALMGNQAQQ